MARKIKFPLAMKNGIGVRTIEELKENFDIESVLRYYKDGKLITWLSDRYYRDKAAAIERLSPDDTGLVQKLLEVFEIDADKVDLASVDLEDVDKKYEKRKILSSIVDDKEILDNMDLVAFNQEELDDILTRRPPKIYLYGDKFNVDTEIGNINYVGINNATVVINRDKIFCTPKGILFTNLNVDIKKSRVENLYDSGKYNEAYPVISEEAEKGDFISQYILGNMYLYGNGRDRSLDEALKWYTKSAEQGYAPAMPMVAYFYCFGLGVKKDENEAIKWCKEAVQLDYAPAQSVLDMVTKDEWGEYEDKNEAEKLFKEALKNLDLEIIEFGRYNGKPIKWIVLDKNDDGVLLFSAEALCSKRYNEERKDITWENCTLRNWLCVDFYNSSFTEEEKSRVKNIQIKNKNSPFYGTRGGNSTNDSVFLLSIEEYFKYIDKGLFIGLGAWWWLRSPGNQGDTAAYVINRGAICDSGGSVQRGRGVRPALYLKS